MHREYESLPIGDQVFQYLISKGAPKLCAGVPYRLIEYNKLRTMWEKLGLNKFDLDRCSPEWISEILGVIDGIERAKSNAMNTSSAPIIKSNIKGKNPVQVKKIL